MLDRAFHPKKPTFDWPGVEYRRSRFRNSTALAIQGMNQQIAAAAEEQSAVAEEINRSVISVRDISMQTATASDETARASTELAQLGNALQQQIGRFRL